MARPASRAWTSASDQVRSPGRNQMRASWSAVEKVGEVLVAAGAVGVFGEEEAVVAGAAVEGVGVADAAEEAVAAVAADEVVGAGARRRGRRCRRCR